ncbi:MAG TPA: type IV toxin-antitoxin system AbiEi family antitoxin domain-containing protein [Terriglobia bacterium]|nr:type IV toxin-antitoxin system AbiEi family antitoxin domain-containing protein [Terriglobia bacterium]
MSQQPKTGDGLSRARSLFRRHSGVLRTKDALRLGIHPETLYRLRDSGDLARLGRGLYRLSDLPPLGNPDLVTVALRVPAAVVCLISALAFHELTTQIPHEVYLALPRGAEAPRLEHPPIRVFWFTKRAFEFGLEVHQLDGTPVRIYSPEKTVADCFKYRNKIGLDTAREALKFYLERRNKKLDTLLQAAEVCRVSKVMRPYLEALV